MFYSRAIPTDPDAFSRIAGAYQDQAYTLAYYLLGDASAAENAAQNAFQSARRDIKRVNPDGVRLRLYRAILQSCRTAPAAVIPSTGSPSRSFPDEEMVRSRLASIPFEYRSALVLVDVAGLDYREAAAVIGTPVATLQKRLALARVRMSEALYP